MGEPVTDHTCSVIVVNWNRRDLLRACLRSLLGQLGIAPQIIVVDNGSTDGSVDLVTSEFPQVTLIQNAVNRGFCAANNQGIAIANGDWIALLNNDAEADAHWLAELLRVCEHRPDVGMVASKILVFADPRRIDKVGHVIWPDGQNRGRGTGAWDHGQFDRVEEVLCPDGCAALYRAKMLREIGGFDEDFFAYADDAELGLRARIAGWNCLYSPRAVVLHHRGATLGTGSVRRLMLIERNRVLLAAKLFPWSLLWLNGFYYARRLFAGIAAALAGRGETALYPGWRGKWRLIRAMISGDLAALRALPAILRKRRELNHIRKLSPRQTRELILAHGISLRELTTQAAVD